MYPHLNKLALGVFTLVISWFTASSVCVSAGTIWAARGLVALTRLDESTKLRCLQGMRKTRSIAWSQHCVPKEKYKIHFEWFLVT